MKYKDINDLEASGYEGMIWMVTVVVLSTYDMGDGTASCESVYWDDGHDLHPFECVFTDYQEAKAYAATFDADMAMWAHTHGNGPEYQHVSVDIVEREFYDGDYDEGDARCMFEWWDAVELQVVEFDEDWKQIGVDND